MHADKAKRTPAESRATRHYAKLRAEDASSLVRFLREYERDTTPWPGRPGTRTLLSCPSISFRLQAIGGRVWLGLIFTDSPGHGFGREGLRWLCGLADQCEVSLYLIVGRPERLGSQFLSNEALIAWYGRNGFIGWGSEGGKPVMVRPSQARQQLRAA
jgi:hypothetical protein